MRLSYSKLNTYRQCPLRYRFTYLDRLPRRPRRLFRAARRIHHALMHWLTYARAGTPRWEQVEAAYLAAWGSPDPALLDSREYQEGLQILRDYHQANQDRPVSAVLLEHKFSVPIGRHVLIGAIDRVDATASGYEVVDYKLDRELRTQAEVDADLQLGLYGTALEEGQGLRPEALTLYFLRHNLQRTTLRTPEQSRELRRWVSATGDDITAERRWSPCAGDHCGGCDFKAFCPAHTDRPLAPVPVRPARPERAEAQLALFLGGGVSLAGEEAGTSGDEGQLSLPLP